MPAGAKDWSAAAARRSRSDANCQLSFFFNPGLRSPPVLKAEHLDYNSQAIHESSLYGQEHAE